MNYNYCKHSSLLNKTNILITTKQYFLYKLYILIFASANINYIKMSSKSI